MLATLHPKFQCILTPYLFFDSWPRVNRILMLAFWYRMVRRTGLQDLARFFLMQIWWVGNCSVIIVRIKVITYMGIRGLSKFRLFSHYSLFASHLLMCPTLATSQQLVVKAWEGNNPFTWPKCRALYALRSCSLRLRLLNLIFFILKVVRPFSSILMVANYSYLTVTWQCFVGK